MNPVELHNFIKEVFHWDADRFAAFATGAILTLLVTWVVRRWVFPPRRGDRWLLERLRKHPDLLKKERDGAHWAVDQAHRESAALAARKVQLEAELQSSEADNRDLKYSVSTLKNRRDKLKSDCARLEETNRKLEEANRREKQEIEALRAQVSELTKVRLEREEARVENERLRKENAALGESKSRLDEKVDELTRVCEEQMDDLADLAADKQEAEKQRQALIAELKQATEKLDSLQSQLSILSREIDLVANSDGRLWERPPGAVLNPRSPSTPRVPIVAVVNLKGGVGKTTLTANLGATLWKQHKRVLLVDLDYQGSLSGLCLSPQDLKQVRVGQRFVQHLFRPQWAGAAGLSHLLTPLGRDLGFLLAADENLLDVEMQALARWLVKPGGEDVRFLLRQSLHDPQVQKDFDFILLDCPPRLTTACVNALACSDYALIPVQLDQTSADAVPRLLQWLRRLRPTLCPELAVLGVVANRVSLRKEALTKGQQDVWNELPKLCEDVWGKPVYFFETYIKQDSAFADAADKHRFAAFDRDLNPFFQNLVTEISRRIATHESSRLAAVREEPHRASQHVGCQ
jgi:cellulose biosynthesis protein BcsQ